MLGVPPGCRASQGSVQASWVGAAVQQVQEKQVEERVPAHCASRSQGEPETQPLPAK